MYGYCCSGQRDDAFLLLTSDGHGAPRPADGSTRYRYAAGDRARWRLYGAVWVKSMARLLEVTLCRRYRSRSRRCHCHQRCETRRRAPVSYEMSCCRESYVPGTSGLCAFVACLDVDG